jgi:thiamine-monophosphate kinase
VPASIRNDQEKGTLGEWGEFRLINEVLIPTLEGSGASLGLGDDCSYLPIPGTQECLVLTCDAAPEPLVWRIGAESYSTFGWYSVLINASDLAAAGAKPLGITTSVEAPSSLGVEQFRDFFSGMAAACKAFDLQNAGGNIRQAPRFECHGMAVGMISTKMPVLTRKGCLPGDLLIAVGESGRFISAYLKARRDGIDALEKLEYDALFRPQPRLREMAILKEAGLLHASSDSSDGVLGALWNIAERSGCAVELTLDVARIPGLVLEAAEKERLDPWNLMFFWGDWQVIVAVPASGMDEFEHLAAAESIPFWHLGRAIPGPLALSTMVHGKRRVVRLLRNENFTREAYNTQIDAQVDYLLRTPIVSDE